MRSYTPLRSRSSRCPPERTHARRTDTACLSFGSRGLPSSFSAQGNTLVARRSTVPALSIASISCTSDILRLPRVPFRMRSESDCER